MNETIKTPLRTCALVALCITLLTSSSIWWNLAVYSVSLIIVYLLDFKPQSKLK